MSHSDARRAIPCRPLTIYSSRVRQRRPRPRRAIGALIVITLLCVLPAVLRTSTEAESIRPSVVRTVSPEPLSRTSAEPTAVQVPAVAVVNTGAVQQPAPGGSPISKAGQAAKGPIAFGTHKPARRHSSRARAHATVRPAPNKLEATAPLPLHSDEPKTSSRLMMGLR